MSKFFHLAVNKFYFKRSFNHISRNCGPLFSQINFDRTYFGDFCPGGLAWLSLCLGGGGYVPEPSFLFWSRVISSHYSDL